MVAGEFVELVAMEDAKLGLADRADAVRAFLPERPPDEVRGKDDADDLLAAVGGRGNEFQHPFEDIGDDRRVRAGPP